MKRAERRHHKERKKAYAIKVMRESYNHTPENAKKFGTMMADHLKDCSCHMCCNPRNKRSWVAGDEKLTLQERRERDRFNSMMDDRE